MDELIKVKPVGLEEIDRRINEAVSRGRNMSPLMRGISGIMADSAEANFEAGGRPQWPDLAPSTKRARAKKGKWPGQILVVSSAGLAATITPFFTAMSAGVGSNKAYAAIQQLGGEIKQKARKHTLYFHVDEKTGEVGNRFVKEKKSNFSQEAEIGEHTVIIPARPYLQLTPWDIAQIRHATLEFLTGH
jgi:phage virion morphogenesis protein